MSQELMTNNELPADMNLSRDVILLKMENESMMSAAKTTTRKPGKIVAQLKEYIEAFPAAAYEAIYAKPVGTTVEVTCAKCKLKNEITGKGVTGTDVCNGCGTSLIKNDGLTTKKKIARGLSIRAAETIRSVFGYTRLSTTSEMLPDGCCRLSGVIVDYAAGNITSDERIISPYYRARGGAMVRTPEDRFQAVLVKAEKSKLRRDIILDNTPGNVKAMYWDMCERVNEEAVSSEVIQQQIIPAFREFGMTPEMLDQVIGKPHSLGWSKSERMQCREILVALKSEETTVAALMADLDAKPPLTGGPVTIDDLVGGSEKAKTVDPEKPKQKRRQTAKTMSDRPPEKPVTTAVANQESEQISKQTDGPPATEGSKVLGRDEAWKLWGSIDPDGQSHCRICRDKLAAAQTEKEVGKIAQMYEDEAENFDIAQIIRLLRRDRLEEIAGKK